MPATFVDELSEWLRIPSISADRAHDADVRRAGEWVCDLVRRAGGDAELVDWSGRPLAVGEVRASSAPGSAPTILVYGHFDVQPPAPLELWKTPPFEPATRDGHLYARGVADDKGQLYLLLKAAELLARAGELPVNVRFACDGEEEIGGHSIVDFLAADERGADACVIYDAFMLARDVPAIVVAVRGLAYFHVSVRTGERDLHSGIYGGAALNALHVLRDLLAAVRARDGRLPEPLRAGIAPPTEEELEDWARLTPGAEELAGQGARPADDDAAREFYVRTWAEPSLDVNGIDGGEAHLQKTVLPVFAEANLSIRLAPGQSVEDVAAALERLLRDAAPAAADVQVDLWSSAPPGLMRADAPVIGLVSQVFERAFGRPPALIRSGGSIPLVPELERLGIQTVLTGFALPDCNAHGPNERLPVDYVERGVEVSKDLYRALAALA